MGDGGRHGRICAFCIWNIRGEGGGGRAPFAVWFLVRAWSAFRTSHAVGQTLRARRAHGRRIPESGVHGVPALPGHCTNHVLFEALGRAARVVGDRGVARTMCFSRVRTGCECGHGRQGGIMSTNSKCPQTLMKMGRDSTILICVGGHWWQWEFVDNGSGVVLHQAGACILH